MPLPLIRQIKTFIKNRKEKTFQEYSSILQNNFQYFIDLSETDKQKFLDRIHKYKKSKNFKLVQLEKDPSIPVLISAAAIQLTFGMKEYTMSYFDNIYITKDAYTYGFSNVAWAGHVNRRGIHISWNHFKQGYKHKNDRYNLGLHEMAHALEYEFHYGSYSNDEELVAQFARVMRQIDGVLFHEGWRPANLYTAEGLQNRHECWAESIELFFENPSELHQHYSDLFNGIKHRLNQDPLKNSGTSQP